MQVHAPGVVDVITLLSKSLHETNILVKPVPLFIVDTVANASIVVSPIAQKDANRLLFAFEDALGIDVAPTEVDKAPDVAEDLTKLIRPLPGDGEGCDRAGA